MGERTQNSDRSILRRLMGVQVVGTGSYVPDPVVTNEQLCGSLGFDAEWIYQRTGIRERRHAPPEVATSDLAIIAAERCFEKAGIRREDVDLLVLGTFTPDMPFPATACAVQEKLGLRCPAMDVQAACAGFMYAMITGMQFVAAGTSELALIIGADCNTRVLNPKDQRTYPLFGDGAGAVLLAKGSPEQGLIAYTLGSDGAGADLLSRPMGGARMMPTPAAIEQGLHYMQMDGRAVFRWACRVLNESIEEVVKFAGMTVNDIDLLIAHQANVRIIRAATDTLGIDRKKVYLNLDRYGNTSAGSVPLALDEAIGEGLVHRGSNLLLSGFGAGLLWGTALMRW